MHYVEHESSHLAAISRRPFTVNDSARFGDRVAKSKSIAASGARQPYETARRASGNLSPADNLGGVRPGPFGGDVADHAFRARARVRDSRRCELGRTVGRTYALRTRTRAAANSSAGGRIGSFVACTTRRIGR